MSTIGIAIDVDYKGQAAFRQMQGDVDRVAEVMRTKASGATHALQKGLGRLIGPLGFGGAGKAANAFAGSVSRSVLPMKTLISAATAYMAIRLGQKLFDESSHLRGLEIAFKAAAGSAEEGAREWEFARATAERLGIDLGVVATSYKGIIAAATASGKSLGFAQEVFIGVAEAGRAMALSNEDIRGTMLAVQQIMSKGVVNAEELRQQLGERFPVAIGVMARALNVSTAELSKMMEQGKITSDALLPWARQLREEYGSKLADALVMGRAELNRLSNDGKEFAKALGEGGLDTAVATVARSLRTLFDVAAQENLGEKIGGALKVVAEGFGEWIKTYGPGAVKAIGDVAGAIRDNFVPAALALRDTFRQVMAGYNLLIGGVLSGAAKMVGALEWIIEASAKVSDALGFDDHAEQLRALNTRVAETREQLAAMGETAFQATEKWYNSTAQAQAAQEQITATVKLTAAEVRKLGDDALVTNGKVVDAGRKVAESVDTWKSRLVQVNGVWTSTGTAATQSLERIATESVKTGQTIETSFKKAGASAAASMDQAADAVEKSYDRMKARSEELDKMSKGSLMSKQMASIQTDFASDRAGLQAQLTDAIRARADIWRVGAGVKGYYEFATKESDKLIAELNRRIAALDEQAAEKTSGGSDDTPRLITTRNTSTGSRTGSSSQAQTTSRAGNAGGRVGDGAFLTEKSSGNAGGGRVTTINNPQFVVDIRGVDEQMINSRNLVQQLLPELRRAVAQGELENTSR